MVHSLMQDFEYYHHRANIISMIMEKSGQLSASTQLASQHDDVSSAAITAGVTISGCAILLQPVSIRYKR